MLFCLKACASISCQYKIKLSSLVEQNIISDVFVLLNTAGGATIHTWLIGSEIQYLTRLGGFSVKFHFENFKILVGFEASLKNAAKVG